MDWFMNYRDNLLIALAAMAVAAWLLFFLTPLAVWNFVMGIKNEKPPRKCRCQIMVNDATVFYREVVLSSDFVDGTRGIHPRRIGNELVLLVADYIPSCSGARPIRVHARDKCELLIETIEDA